MGSVLVAATQAPAGGSVAKEGRSALAFGRRLADSLGVPLAAVVLGPSAAQGGRDAIACGADRSWALDDPSLGRHAPDRYVAALEAAARAADASHVVMAFDALGKDVIGRLAHRLEAAAVTEVVGFRSEGGGILWERPVYGGKATGVFRAEAPRVVIGLRPKSVDPAVPDPARAGAVEPLAAPSSSRADLRVIAESASEGARLEDARVIVSGGRGLGGPAPFVHLQRLADVLGGAVGASRAACDAGWVPATYQVGQTGALVAPDLYIAIGISGASQHLAGIGAAKTVVAINADPNAPIFKRADVGIVGDYKEILPALEQELRKALENGS